MASQSSRQTIILELRNVIHVTVTVLICLVIAGNAHASELIMSPFHGISIYSEDGGKVTSIRVVVDKTELLDSFAYWKGEHGLRSETTETDFRSHPYSYAAAFALYGGVVPALHGEFARFRGSPVKITGEIVEADQYGHSVSHQMFSFTFTKILNSKIDWDGFDAMSFQTIAPDFHYSSWFQTRLHKEPSQRS